MVKIWFSAVERVVYKLFISSFLCTVNTQASKLAKTYAHFMNHVYSFISTGLYTFFSNFSSVKVFYEHNPQGLHKQQLIKYTFIL